MSGALADRNLLLGVVALQMDFISRDALIIAMNTWALTKATPLSQILKDQGALTDSRRFLLDAMVAEHIQLHEGDPQRSLAAMSSIGSVRELLSRIADPDLQASLPYVSAACPDQDNDSKGTITSTIAGDSTSAGTRFRILRPHAKGGLGEVFVARDTELNRDVALKEIQSQFAFDPRFRSRFEFEAEVTGGLEHPGIVPVYGLGHLADGRPFYAMRFIKGDSLKEAIRRFHEAEKQPKRDPGQSTLELRDLLGRFIDVCNAVAYAHSRGVLHRDLKPGNIMLGKYGETLVVDWGLAKALEEPEADSSIARTEFPLKPLSGSALEQTVAGSAVGTPAYMSPEQVDGRVGKLGVLSDVYCLGATLYHLLTGHAPCEAGERGAIYQRVLAGDISRPRSLNPRVAPALEAICLKALALDPAQRYKSSHAMKADLELWLADEPVAVWREPLALRARRWARRNRSAVTSAGASLIVMTAAFAVILAIQSQAKRHLEIAHSKLRSANELLGRSLMQERAATEAAKSRFALALRAIQSYRDGVDQADVLNRGDLEPVRNKLLATALTFYKELSTALAADVSRDASKDDALLQAYDQLAYLSDQIGSKTDAIQAYQQAVELGHGLMRAGTTRPVRNRLGGIYLKMAIALEESGRADQAYSSYREAIVLQTALVDEDPANLVSRGDLARTYFNFGHFQGATGRPIEALESFREAITRLDELTKTDPKNPVFRQYVADALTNLGLLQMNTRELAASLATFSRAAQIIDALRAEEPTKLYHRSSLARIYNNIGMVHRREGAIHTATTAYQKAIKLQEALALEQPAKTDVRRDLGTMHNNLGNIYNSTGQADMATAEFREAIRLQQSLVHEYPQVASYRQLLARSFQGLGNAHFNKRRFDDAVAAYGSAIALQKVLVHADPSTTVSRIELGRSFLNLGGELAGNGQYPRALLVLREGIAILEALARENPTVPTYRSDLAHGLANLGGAQNAAGLPAEGERSCRRAVGLLEELIRGNPTDMQMRSGLVVGLNNLGNAMRSQRNDTAALLAFRTSAEHLQLMVSRAPQVAEWRTTLNQTYRNIASVLRAQNQVSEAAATAHRCVELSPSDSVELYNSACDLALCIPLADRLADAQRYGNEAMAILRRAAAAGWSDRTHAVSDPDLKSLHSRRDFQEFVLDHIFPADPFAH